MSKILFITQKVDLEDDVLGIYHQWIEELAKRVEKVNVICLYKGKYKLPSNVDVYSLGKEDGESREKYIKNFFKYIWRLRKDYESVFVHMNPEYVILGSWLWKLMGKKIVFWYAHYLSNLKLRFAAFWPDKIVTSTRLAYPLKSKKLEVLQQGIDIQRFKAIKARFFDAIPNILFLGRIAPVKNLDILLKAIHKVRKENDSIALTVIGDPTPGKEIEKRYFARIQKMVKDLELEEAVSFSPSVPNYHAPEIYNQHDLFINLTDTGSFDKTTLEAMSCELPVLVSNRAFSGIFSTDLAKQLMFEEKNADNLASQISAFINLSNEEKSKIGKKMRSIVVAKHSLSSLIDRIANLL